MQTNIEYIVVKGKTIYLLSYGPAEIILKSLKEELQK